MPVAMNTLSKHQREKLIIQIQILSFLPNLPITVHIHKSSVGYLARFSDLAISHDSSSILDSLSSSIPSIHYQLYSRHWLKRHPYGSLYTKYSLHCSAISQLKNLILKNLYPHNYQELLPVPTLTLTANTRSLKSFKDHIESFIAF